MIHRLGHFNRLVDHGLILFVYGKPFSSDLVGKGHLLVVDLTVLFIQRLYFGFRCGGKSAHILHGFDRPVRNGGNDLVRNALVLQRIEQTGILFKKLQLVLKVLLHRVGADGFTVFF